MNRVITTLVQLFLVGGAFVCLRLMWQDLKHDIIETIKDIKGGK